MPAEATVLVGTPPTDLTITREHDATPFARLIARALSLNTLTEVGSTALSAYDAVIGVRSMTDSQKATIRRRGDTITVEHGIADDVTAVIGIDPATRNRALTVSPEHRIALADNVIALLNPILPPWQDLTEQFWALAQGVRGMPSLRLVDRPSGQEVVLGASEPAYEIHGEADALARFLAGLEFFADAVYNGALLIRGSFSQFSIVSGASMKVMWDV